MPEFIMYIINAIGALTSTNWLSLLLIIITGVYVFLTWKILKSNNLMIQTMTEQFQESVRPYVTATLAIREGVIFVLEIKNRGKTPATNLELRLDKDFYQFSNDLEDRNLKNFQAFNQTISTFSPRETLSFDLSQGFNMGTKIENKILTPTQFKVSLNYFFLNSTYSETFVIDTAPYMSVHG